MLSFHQTVLVKEDYREALELEGSEVLIHSINYLFICDSKYSQFSVNYFSRLSARYRVKPGLKIAVTK